jgi:hypothetical protein
MIRRTRCASALLPNGAAGCGDKRLGSDKDDALDKLRAAIAMKGRDAKPDDVIGHGPLLRQVGRDGLRTLERRGEYTGFSKPRPARYQK